MGNRHPSIAPYETLHCRGGAIAVACGNDGQFSRLADALGRPGLADDPRFARNPDRVAHRDALVEALEAALREDDADAPRAGRIGDAGVPVGVVGDIGSAIALAESLGLDPTGDVGPGHLEAGPTPYYSTAPFDPAGAPPALGQHNDEIRAWLHSHYRPARAARPAPEPSTAPKETHREHAPAEAFPIDPMDLAGIDDLLTDDEKAVRASRCYLCDKPRRPLRRRLVRTRRGRRHPRAGQRVRLPRPARDAPRRATAVRGMSADHGPACLGLEASDSGVRSLVSVAGSLAMYGIWRRARRGRNGCRACPPARRSGASG